MKPLTIFFLLLAAISCKRANRQFTFEESKFFSAYKPGDTLLFESSQNDIDTFSVITIDSSLRTHLGFFANEIQNDKIIFIRQLPIDTSRGATEEFIRKNRLDHHEFLSAHKRPEEQTIMYCIRFNGFESCTQNSFGEFIDTVTIKGRKFKDCYTFRNQKLRSDSSSEKIVTIYWTVNAGLIAYKCVNGTDWVRKNIR
ncbi:MAG: hypothetical protein ABI581_16985 [Sediminibacterium sp.]